MKRSDLEPNYTRLISVIVIGVVVSILLCRVLTPAEIPNYKVHTKGGTKVVPEEAPSSKVTTEKPRHSSSDPSEFAQYVATIGYPVIDLKMTPAFWPFVLAQRFSQAQVAQIQDTRILDHVSALNDQILKLNLSIMESERINTGSATSQVYAEESAKYQAKYLLVKQLTPLIACFKLLRPNAIDLHASVTKVAKIYHAISLFLKDKSHIDVIV